MSSLATEVKARYHIAVSTRFVERLFATEGAVTAELVYQRALNENFKDITDVGTLPHGVASQVSGTFTSPVVLQVNSSRDATQPLRPCADSSEEEMAFAAALQKKTNTRLLRLVLSDGHAEVPGIELSTLPVFSGIPIPGEKLLVKEGAEVKNGAVIMTENCVVPLGGEVQQLKREFLAMRNRSEVPYQTSVGLEAAPRFQPLRVGCAASGGVPNPQAVAAGRGRGSGNNWGRSGGRGYRGGRGSGARQHRPSSRGGRS
ncbi:uncharacterized protein Tco025E_08399 [Trypanosoma conorhini]|uniref:RecQ-mediated genome instability protein 1 n=1 Tax=Trypanosoma conorhini TaxID=83891 RepID=A0A3R7K6A8_9TRYP|nr:uncharacterized protein Tco025E_08399 [Trypanosoma conorhini]RNF02448.1 hypothetical protein Tco025E_08399 [Trypanosoma conorhini]